MLKVTSVTAYNNCSEMKIYLKTYHWWNLVLLLMCTQQVVVGIELFMNFSAKQKNDRILNAYRISSNKRPGAYKIFSKIAWALIGGGAY